MKNSFESQINKLIKYIFDIGYFGTKLHPNRNHEGQYIKGEPFDYMIVLPNYKACFDAKMSKGMRWRFEKKDIKQAENLKHCKNAGMDAFFLVYFSNYKRMVRYDVDLFLAVLAEGRKHLKITEGEEWDYKKCLEVGKMFERLTHRSQYGIVYTKIAVNESNMVDVGECYTGRIVDRLAGYEDSGLSPEEVQKLKKSDASKEQCTIDQHGEIHRLRDELKRYKQAEQEGRLVVLPCKSEDTIYRIISHKCIAVCNKLKACNSFVYKGCKQAEFYVCQGTFQLNDMEWIGKTVFLTREAAEKALEGLETRKQRGY